MPDQDPKLLRPKSTSGSVRRMQAREIRELQMIWNSQTITPPKEGPRGVYISCSCGHGGLVPGEPEELVERRFRCKDCGKLI